MAKPEPITFNYSTIGRKPGISYEGIDFQGSTRVLVAYDRSAERQEIVVVGLYERGTFNQREVSGLPVTSMVAVDKTTSDEITDMIRRKRSGLQHLPIRFMC